MHDGSHESGPVPQSSEARGSSVVPPSRGWLLPATVAVWTIAGLALAFADRPIRNALWVLTDGVWILYAIAGAGLFLTLVWDGRRRVLSAVALVVLGAGVVLAQPTLAQAGDDFWFERRFDELEPKYRVLAERLSAGTHLSARDTADLRVVLDAGPPLRVAFPQPGGIIDNWEGIVYDPTGAVGAATGWRDGVPGRYSAPVEVRALFGGDLVACRHVRASFYRCWFT